MVSVRAAVYFLVTATVLGDISGYAADLCESINVGIYDGQRLPIEDAPYMAALLYKRQPPSDPSFFCGATIIHERFLLTAAHCYKMCIDPDPTIASIGSERYRSTNTNTVIEVEKALCHEDFDNVTIRNDICLVKLKKPVPFGKNIGKIELADKNYNVEAGSLVNVTGWGLNEKGQQPVDLLWTTIPVLSRKCCEAADKNIVDSMMCAGGKSRGACYGDSGGPLVYKNVQVGVVSRGTGIGCGSGVDVYTRVSSFYDWVHTTIANNL